MNDQDKNKLLASVLLKLVIPATIALLLSIVMTVVHYGLGADFLHNWVKSFAVALVVIPLALRAIPSVSAVVIRLAGIKHPVLLRVVVAMCVAILIECVIAFAVTLVQHGPAAGWAAWWAGLFIKALPLGLLIGVTMTFIVHPRLQKLAA
ncbi:MAG: DUF2798 domain-containing protein [Burkholderiaceae bacterium]